jgi:hypothetical protein
MAEKNKPTAVHSDKHKPGTHLNIYNRHPQSMEVVILGEDGFEIHANVLVGNKIEIITGRLALNIEIRPFNEALVGIPEDGAL